MKKGKAGRPTKLTPETQERVCAALRTGNFRSVAARHAEISYRTFMDWMTEGRAKPDSPEGDFRRAVLRAEGDAELRAVEFVMKAAESDPKHAEWWLSHRHAVRWAEKKNLKMSGKVETGPLKDIPTDRLLAALERDGNGQ